MPIGTQATNATESSMSVGQTKSINTSSLSSSAIGFGAGVSCSAMTSVSQNRGVNVSQVAFSMSLLCLSKVFFLVYHLKETEDL